jgi:ammonia channel protein AmtB
MTICPSPVAPVGCDVLWPPPSLLVRRLHLHQRLQPLRGGVLHRKHVLNDCCQLLGCVCVVCVVWVLLSAGVCVIL